MNFGVLPNLGKTESAYQRTFKDHCQADLRNAGLILLEMISNKDHPSQKASAKLGLPLRATKMSSENKSINRPMNLVQMLCHSETRNGPKAAQEVFSDPEYLAWAEELELL